jgi:outer membrane lipoprotein-sorting protein
MRPFFTVCLLLSGLAFSASAQEDKTADSQTSKIAAIAPSAHSKTIARVEKYLQQITTIRADFEQVAADGSLAKGKFYLKNPGRMRWEYYPPSPILLVSNGDRLVYFDSELEQVNYISLDDTIVGFLGRKKMQLDTDVTALKNIEITPAAIRVTLAQRDAPEQGQLTLEFSDKPLMLKQFIMEDAAGNQTHIALSNIEYGVQIPDSRFIFKDPRGVIDKYR